MHVETEWAAGSGNGMVIVDTTFTNNTSKMIGGALVVNGQGLAVQDTTFMHNTVSITSPSHPSHNPSGAQIKTCNM